MNMHRYFPCFLILLSFLNVYPSCDETKQNQLYNDLGNILNTYSSRDGDELYKALLSALKAYSYGNILEIYNDTPYHIHYETYGNPCDDWKSDEKHTGFLEPHQKKNVILSLLSTLDVTISVECPIVGQNSRTFTWDICDYCKVSQICAKFPAKRYTISLANGACGNGPIKLVATSFYHENTVICP